MDNEVTGRTERAWFAFEELMCDSWCHPTQLLLVAILGQVAKRSNPLLPSVFFISSYASIPERSLLLGDGAGGQSIGIALRVTGGDARKPVPLTGHSIY